MSPTVPVIPSQTSIRALLLCCLLLGTVEGCASSGASSSSLPDWNEYTGRYEFDAIAEGQQVEGYLVLHDLDEYSVRFMFSPGGGNRCDGVKEGRDWERGARARLSGNRLSLSCRGLNLAIRRDANGLEGYATWQVSDTRFVRECIRYATSPTTGEQICVAYANEERTFDRDVRGSLKLTKMSDEE